VSTGHDATPVPHVHPLIAGYHCWCTGVDGAAVVQAVACGAANVDAVRRATGACTRCGSCRPELDACVAQLVPGSETGTP
jgi:NAD(P)H-nitrite reductase large subunit